MAIIRVEIDTCTVYMLLSYYRFKNRTVAHRIMGSQLTVSNLIYSTATNSHTISNFIQTNFALIGMLPCILFS